MSAIAPSSRVERQAYIDLFYGDRDLTIGSPSHYLVFDEALSPVLQAVTLDQLLELNPADASYYERVWNWCDVVDFTRAKEKLWQGEGPLPQLHHRRGNLMICAAS